LNSNEAVGKAILRCLIALPGFIQYIDIESIKPIRSVGVFIEIYFSDSLIFDILKKTTY